MRASLRVMARPSPVPPYRRAVSESAWVKSWNNLACCSAVRPIPGIRDRKLDPVVPVCHLARPQRDLALFGELAGIAQEIEQDLLEPHGVRGERAHVLLPL